MTDSLLTKRVFAEGIGLLSARWNREIDASLSATMAEWLAGQQCTGDEYIAGVKRAVAEDEFFPSARRILELARPRVNAEARAGEVFEKIKGLGRYIVPHGMRWELDTIERECGESARRALVAIGGPRRLVDLTTEAEPFVLRDFAKAFAEFEREAASRHTAATMIASGASRRQLAPGPQKIGDIMTSIHPLGES